MVARIRYFVLGIVVALVLATVAHATTWVFWVGAPNVNNPANGTSVTWGYWSGVTFLYSTQSVRWEVVGNNFVISSTTRYDMNPFGSSGYETWVALSSTYTLDNYVYQGVVGAYENVAIGGTYTFPSGYLVFVAVAWYSVSSETCGQLYFHADVENSLSVASTFYGTYVIANATWSYVTFYSSTVASLSWFNPAVPGPNTCLSPGHYVYVASIKVVPTASVSLTGLTVGTAQVSVGTTSEGTSYTPGTQYAWSKSLASGDTIVVPWTSYANPHINYFVQQVVDTAGSSASGSFYINTPVFWSAGTYASSIYYIIYTYDNDTGYFPQSSIVAIGCPSGIYMLSTTVSPSVTKILSCNGISSPSSGIAIYPTDYAKYSSSPVTYNPPTRYMVTFSYTDSAGNTYSLSDYFAVPTTVYLYITSSSYSISTRQVSFPLQTNLTLFSLQPTNPSISKSNDEGYFIQTPSCFISNNPYTGGGYHGYTGTANLFSCVAVTYGAVSAVVWFYEPPRGMGVILSFYVSFPSSSSFLPYGSPWLNINTGGSIVAEDKSGSAVNIFGPKLSPGWHMAVVEEWANSTSGPYYIALYLDGQYIGTASFGNAVPYLFGTYGIPPFGYLGNGFTTANWPFYSGVNGWFFFNGTIAYVAVYNTVLNSSQVQQLYHAGFPNTLFSNNLVVAYLLTNTTYYVYDGVSHFYIKPYYANPIILNQLGISNASLITITPTGQIGWVPFSQWVPISAPNQVISFCRLLRVYGLNIVSENSTAVTYQVVVGTKTPMNNFPLDYPLLLRYIYYAGIATQTILVPAFVHAFGYGNIYTATISMKKPPSTMSTSPPVATISFPMCNLPPGFVALNQSVITTNVSSSIHLLVTFSVSNPPSTTTAFPGVVYLNNTPYYTFNIIIPPGANGTTSLVKFPIKFNAPNDPGTYVGNVTVFGLSAPIELIVEGPPSVETTNSTSPPSPGTNSTSNIPPPPPPPNTSGSSSSSSSSTSSSSASSSTTTASTILTKLSASLADTLTMVTTYLANPAVIALLVLAIVAIAYIIYKRLTEVVIKL